MFAQFVVFSQCFLNYIVGFLSFLFFAIVLSVFRQIAVFDYPFCIFRLFVV